MGIIDWALLIIFVIMSVLAVFETVRDKAAAKSDSHRTPEATLMMLALAGGALAEYVTMLIIRHKTKHPKFMIGLPVIIVMHVLLAVVYFGWIRKALA